MADDTLAARLAPHLSHHPDPDTLVALADVRHAMTELVTFLHGLLPEGAYKEAALGWLVVSHRYADLALVVGQEAPS
jgi:hypothetical protein